MVRLMAIMARLADGTSLAVGCGERYQARSAPMVFDAGD